MSAAFEQHKGIGMTSQRTRDRLVQRLQEEGIKNIEVLAAISRTPRHIFVDEALATRAYEDTALPIGFGQTISQPYIVARMTEVLLQEGPLQSVLEIGTGCGYQTAILSQLVGEVCSIEYIPELAKRTQALLRELQLDNIHTRIGDGWQGWAEKAPFDAIIVTAAPDEIPQNLLQQLADNGRMVVPVGGEGDVQQLMLVTRHGDEFEEEILDQVLFVPMVKGKK
ncbi:MAG: protein-L-isoaspartate(D-aspartate) O-methyltransferase [Gammaproteobacteria bacterium]|nr:protein-L-isoaspartate(D-aspartate) O-methyltransferase [Gammaproteobacteria bacterium]